MAVVLIVVIALVAVIHSAMVVPHNHVYLIERLGKFSRALQPGFRWRIPLIEMVRFKVSLQEHVIDVPQQEYAALGGRTIDASGLVYVKVVDPVLAMYGVYDYAQAVAEAAKPLLRRQVETLERPPASVDRMRMERVILEDLERVIKPWGLQVVRFEFSNLSFR